MKKLLYLPLLGCLLASCCTTIRLDEKAGYYRLTESQKARVHLTSAPIDSLGYDRDVHVVGIGQVKDFLTAHDSVALLVWFPYQPAERSIPICFEERCAARGVTPCILLPCFFWEQMPLADSLSTPLLFVDVRPYGTDVMVEYLDRIFADLTEGEVRVEKTRGRYRIPRRLMFHRGRFVRDVEDTGPAF